VNVSENALSSIDGSRTELDSLEIESFSQEISKQSSLTWGLIGLLLGALLMFLLLRRKSDLKPKFEDFELSTPSVRLTDSEVRMMHLRSEIDATIDKSKPKRVVKKGNAKRKSKPSKAKPKKKRTKSR
ncbi:MAG: hypothetical protein ACKO5V_02265, partial [Actinomycetota bacterium]